MEAMGALFATAQIERDKIEESYLLCVKLKSVLYLPSFNTVDLNVLICGYRRVEAAGIAKRYPQCQGRRERAADGNRAMITTLAAPLPTPIAYIPWYIALSKDSTPYLQPYSTTMLTFAEGGLRGM